MAKAPASVFTCADCDAQFPKWAGRCEACGHWGTLSEGPGVATATNQTRIPKGKPGKLEAFADARIIAAPRTATGMQFLDTVLAGGLVSGSVTLIAGEPGIGKSTMLAQLALTLAKSGKRIAYVTGEESPAQVRNRLERLMPKIPATLFFLDMMDAGTIAATIESEKPELTIVDSIQAVHTDNANGEAGSVAQVKACAAILASAAKTTNLPLILVGQVTKEGDVAGPRVLEHLVDTVLFLEGDSHHRYRLLRALKHRFGPTDEVAILAMTGAGLEPVDDPSEELLRDRAQNTSGSAVSCLIEGHRPMLIELQALVSPAGYGTPVRRATGVDTARLGILLAVLAKRAGIFALDKDVYANAAGGLDARDPSVDLAVAAAISSAVKDVALDPRLGFFGEIGLAGELRPVGLPELRLKEFQRMGFTKVIAPKNSSKHAPKYIEVIEASSVRDALKAAGII